MEIDPQEKADLCKMNQKYLAEMEVEPFHQLHPLLIDHVIQRIAEHLLADKEDDTVLQARLVSRIWDEMATKALRSHCNKTVYFGKYFRTVENLEEFTNYIKLTAADNFPCRKFYLCEDIFKNSHLQIIESFITDCASLLTSLTVRLDDQSDLKVSEMNLVSLKLQYLKSLVFDDRRLMNNSGNTLENNDINDDNNSDSVKVTCLLEGFVKSSPNLEKLTVIHPPSSIFDDEERAANRRMASEEGVSKMLLRNCPKKLTSLNLDIKLTDTVIYNLSLVPTQIKHLALALRSESVFSKESLQKLLEAHSDSLSSLRFSSMGAKSHFEITFPTLPHLALLELHSWDSQIQGVTFSRITYENHFPSLKSLVLNTWAENPSWIQFFPAAYYGTVPSLTSLKLPQNFMYPAMIQNLSWLYPNLTKMTLHFSKETIVIIQRIFSHFSEHLEELKIRDSLPREKFDFCLDSLFTGLPRLVCEKILRKKSFDPDEKKNHLLKLRQKPSLLNLKNLRKLDIEDMLRHETYVTDVTGYLVLLQMPNLRNLYMGRSQIGDECLGQLAKKYPRNMLKELKVPKQPNRRMLTMANSAGNLILVRAPSNLMSAYNYYCSSVDLVNNCAIC